MQSSRIRLALQLDHHRGVHTIWRARVPKIRARSYLVMYGVVTRSRLSRLRAVAETGAVVTTSSISSSSTTEGRPRPHRRSLFALVQHRQIVTASVRHVLGFRSFCLFKKFYLPLFFIKDIFVHREIRHMNNNSDRNTASRFPLPLSTKKGGKSNCLFVVLHTLLKKVLQNHSSHGGWFAVQLRWDQLLFLAVGPPKW